MFRTAASFLLVASLLVGCGRARLVQRNQTGGTIALEGDRRKATEEAHQMMSQHCQGPYTIVSEGEAVIGQDTATSDETYATQDGTLVNEGGQSTRQATEWRVSYVCGAQAPAPASPPPAY